MAKNYWKRAIIHIDMDAFFASVEQLDHSELNNKPIAVTNGTHGSTIITSSYEARAFGIKTGMRVWEAKKYCPQLIICPSNPARYTEISSRIMHALLCITPDIEIFSIDEAFLDITYCQKLLGHPEYIAQQTKALVEQVSHLTCSVGLSSNKTCAKYAAKLNKPNGLTVIEPKDTQAALHHVPVTELCGINTGIARFLSQYHIYYCGDMHRLPISVLSKRFGNIGKRIWYMCQGLDPQPVQTHIQAPKSLGHSKVLPPNTHQQQVIEQVLLYLSNKVAMRLRRHNLASLSFWIALHFDSIGWQGKLVHLAIPCDDQQAIYKHALVIFKTHWKPNMNVRQAQITATQPEPHCQQGDLFTKPPDKITQCNKTIDAINQRFAGSGGIKPAKLLQHPFGPDVIAPAWQPSGPRQSISNEHNANKQRIKRTKKIH